MLPTATILEIDRLLRSGELSQRQIAARLNVSRGTVSAIANGQRGLHGRDVDDGRPAHAPSSSPKRCPECGYRVYLPCRICEARQHKIEARLNARRLLKSVTSGNDSSAIGVDGKIANCRSMDSPDGLGCLRRTRKSRPSQGGVVMRVIFGAAILAALFPSIAPAAGLARSANFMVYTPDRSTRAEDQRFAELVLERAEEFRREIAKEWLGGELPEGAGRTVIYVAFSDVEDRGLTWAKNHPSDRFHNIWLRTAAESAIGETLKHEVAHAVFATKYPHPSRLPSWLEEGIASRYDDAARRAAREQLVRSWAQGGRAASLAQLLDMPDLRSFDEHSYAAAESLVGFLLTLGDEQTLLRFAEDTQRSGWAAALSSHYQIKDQRDLQMQWQAFLSGNLSPI
jgi:hypothetical protein